MKPARSSLLPAVFLSPARGRQLRVARELFSSEPARELDVRLPGKEQAVYEHTGPPMQNIRKRLLRRRNYTCLVEN